MLIKRFCFGKRICLLEVMADHQLYRFEFGFITFDEFTELIIKITISSLVIGLKMSYFSLIRLPSSCQVVIGQFVIG